MMTDFRTHKCGNQPRSSYGKIPISDRLALCHYMQKLFKYCLTIKHIAKDLTRAICRLLFDGAYHARVSIHVPDSCSFKFSQDC